MAFAGSLDCSVLVREIIAVSEVIAVSAISLLLIAHLIRHLIRMFRQDSR